MIATWILHSLVLALTTDDDALALTVPREVVDATAKGTDRKLEDVLLGVGRVPDADVSSHVARGNVVARRREARNSRSLGVLYEASGQSYNGSTALSETLTSVRVCDGRVLPGQLCFS